MKELTTIRIYFEHGQKIKHDTFWKKIFLSHFSTEIMKSAKAFGLEQVLHLDVTNGYLDNHEISWGINEIRHHKHPHLIEITDSESKINAFLAKHKELLEETKVFIVKSEVLLKSF